MKRFIAVLVAVLLICGMMTLPVNAAQTVKIPLKGCYDEKLGDYRTYGTATITGVLGTTQWGHRRPI